MIDGFQIAAEKMWLIPVKHFCEQLIFITKIGIRNGATIGIYTHGNSLFVNFISRMILYCIYYIGLYITGGAENIFRPK